MAIANRTNKVVPIMVDYGDNPAEILEDRMGRTSLGTVFPSHAIGSYQGVTS